MLLVFICSALPTHLLIRQTLMKVNKSSVWLRAVLKHNWIIIPEVTKDKMYLCTGTKSQHLGKVKTWCSGALYRTPREEALSSSTCRPKHMARRACGYRHVPLPSHVSWKGWARTTATDGTTQCHIISEFNSNSETGLKQYTSAEISFITHLQDVVKHSYV